MLGLVSQVLIYAAVPALAMIASGVAAAFWPPGKKLRAGIQHFAAGVVFAVVAVELLPDVKREHAPLETGVSFALGVVLMLALRVWTTRLEKKAGQGSMLPWGMLIAVGIDVLIDGLLLGIGFAVGARAGLLLTLALGTELLALGLATASSLMDGLAGKRGKCIAVLAVFGVVFVAGGLVGATALQQLPQAWLDMVLSFACAALLYLVTEELLVEAHEGEESAATTAMFFVGFLAFFSSTWSR